MENQNDIPSDDAPKEQVERVDLLTLKDLRQEIGRELGIRRALYPKWIKQKRIYPIPAAHGIHVMEAIYGYLKALEALEAREDPVTMAQCHDFTARVLKEALATPTPKI